MNKVQIKQERPGTAVLAIPDAQQFIDPAVTKAKYDQEVGILHERQTQNLKRGIILLEALFPNVYIAFAAPQLSPPPIVFAVKVNFDNYDVEPLSIQFVHPFSKAPILKNQVGSQFIRLIKGVDGKADSYQFLLQAHNNQVPFLCLPGVREYHKHVFHSGDSWLLHRKLAGEGTLGFLVDQLHLYGIEGISAFQFQLNLNFNQPQISIAVNQQNVPE